MIPSMRISHRISDCMAEFSGQDPRIWKRRNEKDPHRRTAEGHGADGSPSGQRGAGFPVPFSRIKIAFYPLAQPGEEKFAVSDASYEEKPGWIPDISVLFRRDFSFRKFEREYKEKNPDVDAAPLEAAIDRLKESSNTRWVS